MQAAKIRLEITLDGEPVLWDTEMFALPLGNTIPSLTQSRAALAVYVAMLKQTLAYAEQELEAAPALTSLHQVFPAHVLNLTTQVLVRATRNRPKP